MKRFKNILLYAGMEQNEAAVNRAVTLAIENDATLTLMDVVKPVPRALGMLTHIGDSQELQRLISDDHRHRLLQIASEYVDTGVPIEVVISTGDPATEIVRQVLADKHDLVVKTANVGAAGRVFGSIASSLLRICPCPLWLLKPEIHGEFDQVLAAVDLEDFDETHVGLNGDIIELASSIAERENAQLNIVSAWDIWMERSLRRRAGDAEIDAALANHEQEVNAAMQELLKLTEAEVKNVQTHVRRGMPARVIEAIAEQTQADLMVMGTVCRTGAAGLLIGNTAEIVLAHARCSVLALKPHGFVSPIELAQQATAELSD